ncbi:MAG: ABC transporter permease [Chloroflexi bacterium]|nr:ABC transporter permease [Chloroflexota bacterium]
METKTVTVYEPDRQLKMGFLAQWREMFVGLFASRELVWRLFLRDFRAKYAQSVLGISWALINPLVATGLFAYLNSAGVMRISSTGVPYVVFAVVGLTIWNIFAVGIAAGTNSILSAGTMVTKINFPKVSLVFASMGQSIIELFVRVGLAVVVMVIFRVLPTWTVLFVPLAIVPLILLTMGLSLILALLAGLFRDFVNVVTLATTFLMFLVPVLYPAPKGGIAGRLFAWNPLAQLIVGPRDLALYGGLSNPTGFIWSSVFAVAVFLILWRIFHLAETLLSERI